MKLKLYHCPGTRSQRVLWILQELGLDYELVNIDLYGGEGQGREYRRVHPLGQLPALEIDGEVMIESGAIVQWLADRFPDKGLAPAFDDPARSRFQQWMYFAVTTLEGPAWEIGLHDRILPEKHAVKAIVPFARRQLKRVFRLLNRELEGRDYLLETGFSAADILLGYILIWFDDEFGDYPVLAGYIARLQQRPAYQAAKAV